ncbi:SOSS complex subunit C isoform X2 [Carlito syrichta]|uniref:SOSS complex subunit C n=1 Tax=Carlito syrichta TaxID=1868482 RepID=A0A3Q0E5N2_CARSF|nr:SOSS complex subunit C isoform X2 [Carlito syrichta]
MAANTSGQGFQNKNRVAILAELDKEKRKLLMQNQSSTNHPGASIALSRPSLNKDFRDHAEQQHIAAQQKAALQTTSHCVRSLIPCDHHAVRKPKLTTGEATWRGHMEH